MRQILPELTRLGFKTCQVDSWKSIPTVLPPKRRCGIYILHFDSGRYYVGQSVDAYRRYLEHCRSYPNIIAFSFMPIKKDKIELDAWEYNIIQELELQGFPLLNIIHSSISYRSSNFDIDMPLEEQLRWVNDVNYCDAGGKRQVDELLRSKHAERHKQQELEGQPYTEEIIPVLRRYIQLGIPRASQTEAALWNCSYLPSSPARNVYARININWQAVFSAYRGTSSAFFDFWLAGSPFAELSRSNARKFNQAFPGLEIGGEEYNMVPGGGDQVYMIIRNPEQALPFIEHPTVLRAIRIFNLNLMKKGQSPFNRYHCYSLIDTVLGAIPAPRSLPR